MGVQVHSARSFSACITTGCPSTRRPGTRRSTTESTIARLFGTPKAIRPDSDVDVCDIASLTDELRKDAVGGNDHELVETSTTVRIGFAVPASLREKGGGCHSRDHTILRPGMLGSSEQCER